ncbi:MAG: hypothetical protein COT14_00890 [Candidatus Diapherotrites archaeon CG08_land_8_20_14_0_20_30_16]|nr:MAG: hypothetical protein COT14_00890 [Candidatus Diapherotrites archaeon CG08_land_8_20_14_0_20_30_16]
MKKKIKALPKSIRESKRYFLFDCVDIDLRNIKDAFLFLFGSLKLSESGFTIKPVEKKKIIKINRDCINELIFSVFYYNKTQNKNAKIIKESGTLESLL